MPPRSNNYNHAARKRTSTLPSALRTELEELGQLTPLPPNKQGKLGRKDRRKDKRDQVKQNKAKHQQGNGKRSRDDQDSNNLSPPLKKKKEEELPIPKPILKKKSVKFAQQEQVDPPPKKKPTPLEKLVAKQEQKKTGRKQGGIDVIARKGGKKNMTDEDKEILWLEAKLAKDQDDDDFDDGLNELFEGMDDLEAAAFGDGDNGKDYVKLLKESGDFDDLDFDELEAAGQGEESSENEFDQDEQDDDDDEDEDEEEDEEDSSDSNHEEESEFSGSELEFNEGDEEDESGAMTMTFGDDQPLPTPTSTSNTGGRYVPPHLRNSQAATSTPRPVEESSEDPRLRRLLNGHLNKLSRQNISTILDQILSLYSSHPRAIVSSELTRLLLSIVSDRDNLSDQLMITYSGLVASLFRTIGIEFPAQVLTKTVELLDKSLLVATQVSTKQASINLVSFLSELYNFGVIDCKLIYDLIRTLINGTENEGNSSSSTMGEVQVELLSKLLKRSGSQLRSDDPTSLKEIITLVKSKLNNSSSDNPEVTMNSRTKFMIEQLTNLKNNKIAKLGGDNSSSSSSSLIDDYTSLKKFLVTLNKKRATGTAPEPLRVSLNEIRNSSTRGKWWLVGAAWSGDPLLEAQQQSQSQQRGGGLVGGGGKENEKDQELLKLARSQGMNTEVRKGIFQILMSSEDYLDCCQRLLTLGLTEVQQREIVRVLLQCSSNEKLYNPYYTLVAQKLCEKNHSFQITLQYLLWDFLRDLGEKSVGGQELVKNINNDNDNVTAKVSDRKVENLGKLFGWCVGKQALSITILKPIPFTTISNSQTQTFLTIFFIHLFLASHTNSPAFLLPTTTSTTTTTTSTTTSNSKAVQSSGVRKDREIVEKIFIKVLPHQSLIKNLGYYFESKGQDLIKETKKRFTTTTTTIARKGGGGKGGGGDQEKSIVKFGIKIAAETLSIGGSGIVVDV